MHLFSRRKVISVDLKDISLDRLMDYRSKDEVRLEHFYKNEVYHANRIQIGRKGGQKFTHGIHDFEYISDRKEIVLFSRYRKSAFLVYLFPLMILTLFFLNKENSSAIFQITLLFLGTIIFLTLLLAVGIRSESKNIERELVLRINHSLQNQK